MSKKKKLVERILKKRGLSDSEIKNFFITPKTPLLEYSNIPGIKPAVKLLINSIQNQSKIVIHGDYDVDGITGTAILFDYLFYKQKINVVPVIPNRLTDGYGLSEGSLMKVISLNPDLLITVDSGISDFERVKAINKKFPVIITDHHQFKYDPHSIQPVLPDADAIVHCGLDEKSSIRDFCGAATVYALLTCLDRELCRLKLQKESKLDNDEYLELVALATICDIVFLNTENRKIVLKGLEKLRTTSNLGLIELMKIAGIRDKKNLTEYDLGFVIGPRINAVSRVTNEGLNAVRLLVTKKKTLAIELAKEINNLNDKRKQMVDEVYFNLEKKLDGSLDKSLVNRCLIILVEGIAEGIVGLISGKLTNKYNLPSIVFTNSNEDGVIKGSGRSPNGSIDLTFVLRKINQKLIIKWGGHSQAIGISIKTRDLEKFRMAFESQIGKLYPGSLDDKIMKKDEDVDVIFNSLGEIKFDEIRELESLRPFGVGNPEPIFLIKNLEVVNFVPISEGSKHYRILLRNNMNSDQTIQGVIFSYKEKNFANVNFHDISISVLGKLEIDNHFPDQKRMKIVINSIFLDE